MATFLLMNIPTNWAEWKQVPYLVISGVLIMLIIKSHERAPPHVDTGGIYKVFAWGLLFFDENQWMWKHNTVHLQENSSCHINLDNIIVKNKRLKKKKNTKGCRWSERPRLRCSALLLMYICRLSVDLERDTKNVRAFDHQGDRQKVSPPCFSTMERDTDSEWMSQQYGRR